jgi:hypothetical protein
MKFLTGMELWKTHPDPTLYCFSLYAFHGSGLLLRLKVISGWLVAVRMVAVVARVTPIASST